MENEKIHLNFACSEVYEQMNSVSENAKNCKKCLSIVTNYKDDFNINLRSKCGYFSIAQIASFDRSFQFSYQPFASISLLALLGLTSLEIKAQSVSTPKDNTHQQIDAVDKKSINIRGKVTFNGNEYKNISHGTIEVLKGSKIVAIAMTDREGQFELNIDGSNVDLKDLRVTFVSSASVPTLDTINFPLKNEKMVTIHMTVTPDWDGYAPYDVMGGIRESYEPPEKPTVKPSSLK